MRPILSFVCTACLVALVLLAGRPQPVHAEAPAATAPDMPAPNARAAIVVDAATGEILYARDETEELHPASLTKMVTALVAVERAPLDRMVRPTHDYDVTPVVIGIGLGDSLPLRDVLYGLLLNSGNDAALAIAETVGDGSIDRFVGWMNGVAAGLHLEHTHFKNPHGLDTDGHVSSAYDMSVIGRAVMRQPGLAILVGTPRHVVDGPPRWVFSSINPLLGNYPGVDGIKTGFDDLAGRCLVATASRDGRRTVAVVMHSDTYADDAASLLDYAFADKHWRGTVAVVPPSARLSTVVTPRVAALRADLESAGDDGPPTLAGAAADVEWIQQGQRVFIAP
jgi:D-alanyl-D-alanine carboxypeptidase (penicillin-binding protein 5/6)